MTDAFMPLLRSRAFLCFFVLVAAASVALLMSRRIVRLHNVVIGKGGGRDLHAEIAYPNRPNGLLPAIIYIHGGGWITGSPSEGPIEALAKAGYFAASIEYRLSGEAKWPAQIEDCKLGVRWLRANASKYHVAPDRIGVWGGSAGGHLALCLDTMADVKNYEGAGGYPGVSSAVQAVVDFCGATDFMDPGPYGKEALRFTQELFGVPHDQNPELWKSGSPIAYVKAGDAPLLLVYGDSDRLCPLIQATAFETALTKAGVPHRLIVVKNGMHGFQPVPGKTTEPSFEGIMRTMGAFFDQYLRGGRAIQ